MREMRVLNVQQRILCFAANSMWIKHITYADGSQPNHHHSGSLTEAERLDYINAVKCLQKLPPRSPARVVPGARSRVRGFQPPIDTAKRKLC